MPVRVGEVIERRRSFSQDDFNRFAALSWDDNPIHVDPEFSARTRFGATVAHGMFLYTALSGVLEGCWPDWMQVEQVLMFPNPTYAGQEMTIRLQVSEVLPDGSVWLETTVTRPDGLVGLQGRMRVRPVEVQP